ncbi:MAG: glycerophosphodiester phosphodiesterase, partial [Bdellovibrionales bacterium]
AQNGLGIELDLQITRDQVLLVAHDATIEQWTGGKAKRAWNSMTSDDITKLEGTFGPVTHFSQVLGLAKEFPEMQMAVHLKGGNQTAPFVQKIIETLKNEKGLFPRILIFDLKPDIGKIIRQALPGISLAASIAHEYDIARFKDITHGTLMSIEEILPLGQIFDWVWMDEWDRSTMHEGSKDLYNPEVVEPLRKRGFKIAMISPGLHKADGHEDGQSVKAIQKRWKSMIASSPDAICTDYPARLLTSLKTS